VIVTLFSVTNVTLTLSQLSQLSVSTQMPPLTRWYLEARPEFPPSSSLEKLSLIQQFLIPNLPPHLKALESPFLDQSPSLCEGIGSLELWDFTLRRAFSSLESFCFLLEGMFDDKKKSFKIINQIFFKFLKFYSDLHQAWISLFLFQVFLQVIPLLVRNC